MSTAEQDQREFARIPVSFPASIQPLDPQSAERLRERILTRPSVWAPSNESSLRELAASGSGGPETLLAEAILELAGQVDGLRRRVLGASGPPRPASVHQLSGGGGLLVCDLRFEPGDLFEIHFEDEDFPAIAGLGRIVHATERGDTYGFRFEALHSHDQDRLIRAIYQLQRRALRQAQHRP